MPTFTTRMKDLDSQAHQYINGNGNGTLGPPFTVTINGNVTNNQYNAVGSTSSHSAGISPTSDKLFTERYKPEDIEGSDSEAEEAEDEKVEEGVRSELDDEVELRAVTKEEIDAAFASPEADSGEPTEDPHSDAAGAVSSSESKIPRPRNPWILYRSSIIDTFAEGGDLPGLQEFLEHKHASMILVGRGPMSDPQGVMDQFRAKHKKAKGLPMTSEEKRAVAGKMMGIQHADLTKLISPMWRAEPESVKAKFEREADVLKIEVSIFDFVIFEEY